MIVAVLSTETCPSGGRFVGALRAQEDPLPTPSGRKQPDRTRPIADIACSGHHLSVRSVACFIIVLAFAGAGGLLPSSAASARTELCLERQATRADAAADGLTSWRQAYSFFRRYRDCDDGAIAEGFSDGVAELLANHWTQIRDLDRLSRAHPSFRAFVLKHINGTIGSDQVETILANATRRCPRSARELCHRVAAAARTARNDMRAGDVR
jgi:hypothetical protein